MLSIAKSPAWSSALYGVVVVPIFLVIGFTLQFLLCRGVLGWPLLMTFITFYIWQTLRRNNANLWYSAAVSSVLMFAVGAVYGMMSKRP
jgi:hypothetical protein